MAVATLFTVTPAASAAPAALTTGLPSEGSPVSLVPGSAQGALLAALTPPTLLRTGAASATAPVSLVYSSAAARVIALARSHLGARWVYAASGPRAFDCSGLVLRAYSDAGLVGKLGGWGNRSGYAIYAYGLRHHLVSRTNGQPGDVVVWGGGGHVGIYLGHGMAISTLVSGVRIHGIYAVTKRFTAFVHTGLTGVQAAGVTRTATTTTTTRTPARSIGLRHAGGSLALRIGHATDARTISTLRAGTRLTLLNIWHDARGRTWYRVNANTHVGWVAGWLTTA
jgi:cell wall-associated NlpC family hydrolase